MQLDERDVRSVLQRTWSIATAVQWTADNPVSSQRSVSAAVIHGLFGAPYIYEDPQTDKKTALTCIGQAEYDT